MKRLLILLWVLFLILNSNAQVPQFISGFNIGGSSDESITHAEFHNGKIYISGVFQDSVDVDPGPAVRNLYSPGRKSVFILVLKNDSVFDMAFSLGSTDDDQAPAIAIDQNDNIYLAGFYTNPDFDFDPSSAIVTRPGIRFRSRAYLAKYDYSGKLIWVNAFGSTSSFFEDISWNGSQLLAVAGTFKDSLDLSGGNGLPNWTFGLFGDEGIVYTCDTNGIYKNHFAIVGNGHSKAKRICFDSKDNVVLAGTINYIKADLKPGTDTLYIKGTGNSVDFFLAKYNYKLDNLFWGFAVGGVNTEWVEDLCVNSGDSILIAGGFADTVDFDPHPINNWNLTGHNNTDAFGAMYSENGDLELAVGWGTVSTERAYGIIPYKKGSLIATGNMGGNGYTVKADFMGMNWTMEQRKGGTFFAAKKILSKQDGAFYIIADFSSSFMPVNDPRFSRIVSNGGNDIAILKYSEFVNPNVLHPKAPEISIYPNPAYSHLSILSEELTETILVIYDMNGKLVKKTAFLGGHHKLIIEDLRSGRYFIKFKTDKSA